TDLADERIVGRYGVRRRACVEAEHLPLEAHQVLRAPLRLPPAVAHRDPEKAVGPVLRRAAVMHVLPSLEHEEVLDARGRERRAAVVAVYPREREPEGARRVLAALLRVLDDGIAVRREVRIE